jgi:hypothetical protein
LKDLKAIPAHGWISAINRPTTPDGYRKRGIEFAKNHEFKPSQSTFPEEKQRNIFMGFMKGFPGVDIKVADRTLAKLKKWWIKTEGVLKSVFSKTNARYLSDTVKYLPNSEGRYFSRILLYCFL